MTSPRPTVAQRVAVAGLVDAQRVERPHECDARSPVFTPPSGLCRGVGADGRLIWSWCPPSRDVVEGGRPPAGGGDEFAPWIVLSADRSLETPGASAG